MDVRLVKFCPVVYHISSVIRRRFSFQNNLKDLDPSCGTDFDL